jgi:methylated-DNA-[protein]-cysteine S-methyltransferase
MNMRYDIMNSELGPILFSRDDKGINRVHFLDSAKPLARDESWQQTSQDPLLQKTRSQLKAYFSGKRRQFSLPLSMEGTDFQIRVWKTLISIPYGRTWSYKELATTIGNPAACRAVGNANGKNKLSVIVP